MDPTSAPSELWHPLRLVRHHLHPLSCCNLLLLSRCEGVGLELSTSYQATALIHVSSDVDRSAALESWPRLPCLMSSSDRFNTIIACGTMPMAAAGGEGVVCVYRCMRTVGDGGLAWRCAVCFSRRLRVRGDGRTPPRAPVSASAFVRPPRGMPRGPGTLIVCRACPDLGGGLDGNVV